MPCDTGDSGQSRRAVTPGRFDAAAVRAYSRRMADVPSPVTQPPQSPPPSTRRVRRSASGAEQERRKAWGKKWGALVSSAIKKELGKVDTA